MDAREGELSPSLATHPQKQPQESLVVYTEDWTDPEAKLANAWSADGFTPLHFACFFAQQEMASFLLQHSADPNAVARNPMKVAPLHSATAARNLPIVTILLTHGASPDVQQQQGWTPLHSAAQHGDRAMAELLLKHGANRFVASDDGVTPAALATKNGHAEIAKLLS